MSQAPSISNDNPPEPDDPVEVVEEHRELFERIADTDLRTAKYFERALAYADEHGEGPNV